MLVAALLALGILVVVPVAIPLHPAARTRHALVATLAGCAWRRRPAGTPAVAAVLVVVAPPVVAVGFTTYAPLQVAGAALLAVGIWTLAWETTRRVVPATDGVAKALLLVSAVATLAPMVLAVQWAVGTNYGLPALSIPDMARWHGTTNAIGFVLLGVVGWRLQRDPRLGFAAAPGGARS